MAEPRGAFGEVPLEVLVFFWGMEQCGGAEGIQVMGAALSPMGRVFLPLDLFGFGIRSLSLAPFLQILGFPLETLGGSRGIPGGMWDEKVPGWSCSHRAQGIPLEHGCSQLSWKQLLLEPQPRAPGLARVWDEYLGKPYFLSSYTFTFLTFNKWVVSGCSWATLVPRRACF